MLLYSSVGEDSWEPLGLQENQPVHPKGNQSLNIRWKDWCWSWNSNTLATWCEELTHMKRPWCWKRLKAGGEGDDRGWNGWMASPPQWIWVWVNSGSWWWTGRPGVVRVGHDWATALNWYAIYLLIKLGKKQIRQHKGRKKNLEIMRMVIFGEKEEDLKKVFIILMFYFLM